MFISHSNTYCFSLFNASIVLFIFRLTVSKLASFSVQIMTRLSGASLSVSKEGDMSPAGAGPTGGTTAAKGGTAAAAELDAGEPKITTPQGAAQALISYFLTAQTL